MPHEIDWRPTAIEDVRALLSTWPRTPHCGTRKTWRSGY